MVNLRRMSGSRIRFKYMRSTKLCAWLADIPVLGLLVLVSTVQTITFNRRSPVEQPRGIVLEGRPSSGSSTRISVSWGKGRSGG